MEYWNAYWLAGSPHSTNHKDLFGLNIKMERIQLKMS